MRSFAEYRKIGFKSKVHTSTIQESINCFLELLRMDLLEKVKLPEILLEANLALNTIYNHSVKEDYEINKELIEGIIRHYEANLYPAIIEEAQAAVLNSVVSPDPMASFESELVKKVTAMAEKLKQDIQNALNATRGVPVDSPEEEDPLAAGTPSPVSSGSPAPSHGTHRPSPVSGGSPAAGSAAPAPSSPSAGTSNHSHAAAFAGHTPPATGGHTGHPSGFIPAPIGSFRPADGYRKGLGRLLGGLVPRSWRQAWHNDPTRQMSKEHIERIDNILLENTQAVSGLVDAFRDEIVQFVMDKVRQIASVASKNPAVAAAVAASPAGATGKPLTAPIDVAERGLDGTTTSNPNIGTDPNAVNLASDKPTPTEIKANAGDEASQEKINQTLLNIKAACEAIGMKFDAKIKHRNDAAWDTHKVKTTEIFIDGKSTKDLFGGNYYGALVRRLSSGIYESPKGLNRKLTDSQNNHIGDDGNHKRNFSKRVFGQVADFLNLKNRAGNIATATEMLQKFGAIVRGGHSASPAVAASPKMTPSAGAGNVTSPAVAASPEITPSASADDIASPAITAAPSNVQPPKIGTGRGRKRTLPVADTSAQNPEEFINNFMTNHKDAWDGLVQGIGGIDQAKDLISGAFEAGQNPNDLLTDLLGAFGSNKQKPEAQPDTVAEPEMQSRDLSSDGATTVAEPDATEPEAQPESETPQLSKKERIIDAFNKVGREPNEEELAMLNDLDDDTAEELINAIIAAGPETDEEKAARSVAKANPAAQTDAVTEPEAETQPDTVTQPDVPAGLLSKDQEEEIADTLLGQMLDKSKQNNQGVSSDAVLKQALSKLGISDEIIDRKLAQFNKLRSGVPEPKKELLTDPRAKVKPEEVVSPDKDLNGSEEYMNLKAQLKKALADTDTMDDDQLRSAMVATMKQCEKMIDDGGTVNDVLNSLRQKIADANSLRQDAANVDRLEPETPPSAPVSPEPPKSKSGKKLKGGISSKNKGLGDLDAKSFDKAPKNQSEEDFLKAHPEFANSGDDDTKRSELDVDPDHIDRGGKKRKKKKLAEGSGFDAIIDRFKQRLMENQSPVRSRLTSAQKLIFS